MSKEPINAITRPVQQKRYQIMVNRIVYKNPILALSLKVQSEHENIPKNGMLRPTSNVDITNAVRIRIA